MDKDRIRDLVDRFNRTELDESGLAELERLIEGGAIDLHEFPSLQTLHERLEAVIAEPGKEMDISFYAMLHKAQREEKAGIWKMFYEWTKFPGYGTLFLKTAFSLLLVLAGIGIGALLNTSANRKELNRLSDELTRMQQTVMLTLLDKSSATERLRAINLTGNIEEADDRVIDALLKTLDQDENVNVRLAAIDALLKYSGSEKVRMGLIASITSQELPIMQVALADAMVLIQEKRGIEPMRELIKRENIDVAVRNRLEKSIDQLI